MDPLIGFLGFVLIIGGISFFWTAYDIDWGIKEEIEKMQSKPVIPNITKLLEERIKLQYVLAISVLVMLVGAYFLLQVINYHLTH